MIGKPAWPWSCLKRWRGRGNGAPAVSNTGIQVRFLFSRWLAGESIEELALDYGLHPTVIEQAFREWAGKPRNWETRVEVRK